MTLPQAAYTPNRMPTSGRKRASLALLLVLAVGLVAAGVGAAANAREMMCCSESMETRASGCAWLGAGDCCTAAPTAPAPSSPAPPAPASCGALTLAAFGAGPAAIPSSALAVPNAHAALRNTVLRL